MSEFEILENKGALTIIYVLNSLGKINRKILVKNAKTSGNTIDRRLLELKTAEIINVTPKEGYQGSRRIWLTEKGYNIAKNINFEEIKELVEL